MSNPTLRNMFGIGRGTANTWKIRVVKAIRSIRDEYIKWPDAVERKEIANRINSKYSLLHCVGIADGTLFPLMTEPETLDAPAYSGRKHLYSMTVMIINDDKKKIRCYLSGFPSSAHDQRVYSNTPLCLDEDFNFSDELGNLIYFIIGDSAFTNSKTMVAA